MRLLWFLVGANLVVLGWLGLKVLVRGWSELRRTWRHLNRPL